MARISVIVPVYNVEGYLALSLDSIRRQSFTDIEILCVDDGATDRSADILALAAAVEPRLRVVTKPNGGLSSARNAGIEAATGDIVMFADSDDLLRPHACRKVAAAFETHQPDIVTFGAYCYPESSGYPWLIETLSPRDAVYTGFRPALLFEEKSRPFVWRTAVTADFLRRTGLRFDETVAFGEDQIFHFLAYPAAAKTVLIEDKLYDYRVTRRDSLMGLRGRSPTLRLREHQTIARRILQGWREHGWLQDYPVELIEWLIDFLVGDIFAQPGPVRRELLASLAGLFREFFPGDLPQGLPPATRDLVTSLVTTPADAAGGRVQRLAVTRHYLASKGMVRGARRAARGVLGSWPVEVARGLARQFLPARAASLEQRFNEVNALVDDSGRRLLALELLKAEAAQA